MDLLAILALPGQPGATFRAIEGAAQRDPGHRLFTVMRWDAARGVSWRVHTSRPDAYPLGGEKPLPPDSDLFRHVVAAGIPRFCSDRAAIVRGFADHERILALGCEAAVNVPVRWNGRTLGAINLLGEAGRFRPAQATRLLALAALAVAPLLAPEA